MSTEYKKLYSDISWNGGVATIHVEDLANSAEISDITGRHPKARPVPHFQFIQDMYTLLDNNSGDDHVSSKIIVFENEAAKVGMKNLQLGDTPVQNIVFRKVIGILRPEVDLLFPGSPASPQVAFQITEKGITAAFGHELAICENFNILGRKSYMTTIGEERDTYDAFLEKVTSKIVGWRKELAQEVELANRMNEMKLERNHVMEFVGMFCSETIIQNRKRESTPIGMTDMNNIVEEIFESKTHPLLVDGKTSAWNLYNNGTRALDIKSTTPGTGLQKINFWKEYLMERLVERN